MTDIHRLVTRPEKISAEVVSILKDFLQQAERGEIVAIAVASVASDGASITRASATDNQIELLGAVSRLTHRMHINADGST